MNAKNFTVNPCIICHHDTRIITDSELKKPTPVVYHVCKTCELIIKAPFSHPTHEDEKTLYMHHNNSMENVGYVNMFNRFIAAAVDPFITTGSGLDFGSGPGPVLYELLKQKGFTMTHYDPYFHPDKTALNNTYDLITSTEVFEHLSDPLATFKRLESMLNTHGILAIMTNFHPKHDETFLSWWYRRDPTHIAFYTTKTFEYLSKETSLQCIYTNHKNIIVFKK
ncbi:MAG: class I SAM-dependent methyltransferase [Bacillota bacterium]